MSGLEVLEIKRTLDGADLDGRATAIAAEVAEQTRIARSPIADKMRAS